MASAQRRIADVRGARVPGLARRVRASRLSLATVCFATSLAVYVGVRLVGLTEWPISFIGDEAIQVADAASLSANGFRDQYGDLLPTYLRNGPYLNLGLSVYLQLVPYWLFGYSELAARAVTVVVTLFGAAALAFALRQAFGIRFWWTGVLLLSAVPAWFLHSRTALEAPIGCSFYAWFLALYLRFRASGSPWALYGAVVAGALAFYSYAPLKVVVVATAVLLALSDARWLVRRGATCVRALAVVAVLALPELRFQLLHQGANVDQLRVLGSYIVDPELGAGEKLRHYVREHAVGLSPGYWFEPDEPRELPRHKMAGYGNALVATAPLALVGIVRALARIRDARYRALLLATLAAPVGPALVQIQLPRSLVVVVPLTLLTALGLDTVASALTRVVRERVVAVATLVLLCAVNVFMVADALRDGPTWYRDYGLYGMQFGGREIGDAVRQQLEREPSSRVVVTSNWGNASDVVIRFFVPDEPRVVIENPEGVIDPGVLRTDVEWTLFVLAEEELERIRADVVYEPPEVVREIPLPDGRPGFSLVRLRYSSGAAAIVASRREGLRQPVTEPALIAGSPAQVEHPPLDVGTVADLFDGDRFTVARTTDVPVLVLVIAFERPTRIGRIRVVGEEPALALEAEATVVGRATPLRAPRAVDTTDEATVAATLAPRPLTVSRLVLRISDPSPNADRHVHVAEITVD